MAKKDIILVYRKLESKQVERTDKPIHSELNGSDERSKEIAFGSTIFQKVN